MNVKIAILVGDLFEQPTHLVVGFTDTFDTDMSDHIVISPSSVQGQFQKRYYFQRTAQLDADICRELRGSNFENRETTDSKPRGKLERYPIGTVVTLGDTAKRFFCLAYGRMSNILVVESNVTYIWKSLDSLWESVRAHTQLQPISVPVIGSDLARITSLDFESLLKMIILSFVAQSRTSLVCRELRVIVHPKDIDRLNMLEVSAFLRAL
ncbi:macro domain-containing protein [Actinomadura macra]|uniref:macro domain-containing protein n=1 Tax=Actinomadura macra TaxID=46164 RepID=UPI00350E5B40